jgi:thiamine-phosphate pyrophosphorylase
VPEKRLPAALRLMLVADDRLLGGRDLVAVCIAAELGGVTSIQVRLTEASPRDLAAAVRAVRQAVRIPVLVNERADVAIACGAAGVHLGPDDVPVPLVRRIAPRGFTIGASVGTMAEVENGRGADYWAVGPWRATGTPGDTGAALGPQGFAAIVRRAEGRPCVAIGGVTPGEVSGVLEVGGAGIAVGSGILDGDVEAGVASYRHRLPATW